MPRTPRVILPHYPHHVVQRGHNRQVIFAEPRDYERYLDTLREFKKQYGVAVYAFCLITNHVHLLLAPREPDAIGKLMKRLAGRQTRHHNRPEGRIGTLWEGRYKSSVVQHDDYLFACFRYIELNPVRARIVAEPQDYAWSSCRYRPSDRTPPIGSTTIRVTSPWEEARASAAGAIASSCAPQSRAGNGS